MSEKTHVTELKQMKTKQLKVHRQAKQKTSKRHTGLKRDERKKKENENKRTQKTAYVTLANECVTQRVKGNMFSLYIFYFFLFLNNFLFFR